MRVIRRARPARRWDLALSLGMLVVGFAAILLMAVLPGERASAVAVLGAAAALALGVGLGWMMRALGESRQLFGEDLARLLAPAFDDSYVLILEPRLPGVPADLAALLVGPPGVRAIVARHWRGRYRVRGRGWEYDTRSHRGWIRCRTNPSFDADTVADAVSSWARTATDEPGLPVVGAIAFPRSYSVLVLEEPDSEIITTDNAPWWAQRIGKVQRLDAQRAARFVQAVLDASEATAAAHRVPQPSA
ncbi:MAG TPA: hypothetical protein VFH63_01760 [candidate division Zixibacteria bacterium]|nr:hypothetical protein [candidate division Zixibacteria bacterium]